ncbi:unnamed protein product [Pleuronectes platessa]|uniref:Uncharacterized protein n=1 Tax=Pleuronectes platessa TaxID=8262 RepID=A0A9N7U0J1_PLEPL|nr:unnamed protein product [Pleuronectes platessa]
MEEQDAAADPYLPYDGGGDTIPLQEIPRKGTPHIDGGRAARSEPSSPSCVVRSSTVSEQRQKGPSELGTQPPLSPSALCSSFSPQTSPRLHHNVWSCVASELRHMFSLVHVFSFSSFSPFFLWDQLQGSAEQRT